MSQFLRYVCVSALAFVAWLAFAFAVAIAVWVIVPEGSHFFLGPHVSFRGLLGEAVRSGGFLGVLVAPFVGVLVMRQTNRICDTPERDRDWWRVAHVRMGWNALAMAVACAGLAALRAAYGVMRSEPFLDLRRGVAGSLVWGVALAAGILVLGMVKDLFWIESDE